MPPLPGSSGLPQLAAPPVCSRAVGHRFGRHLSSAVPLAISYCDEAGDNEEELQEYCLQVEPYCSGFKSV
jgi:hypothetical protein